ncbi:hypothetical protein EWM64_g10869 [Hericium alpestre]|uniref:Uncharacterized protein n=1 Tax=Hericium alpestre TaxID=135208 RepID=A0A4Y9ZH43_9AGAM|nr:hypothetical protein EWM64_g10869 [Hericium alpestre]
MHEGEAGDGAKVSKPEQMMLWMPSELSPELHQSGCVTDLVQKEQHLQIGQADNTLHHIHRQLCICMGLLHYKHVQVAPSQAAETRARKLLLGLSAKLDCLVKCYQAAYAVINSLNPGSEWTRRFKPLAHDELHRLTSQEQGVGQGRRQLMWIWRVQVQDAHDLPEDNGQRHLKRKYMRCWEEEVILLHEEMWRGVAFFEFKSAEWLMSIGRWEKVALDITVGADAYTMHQGAVYKGLALACAGNWHCTLITLGLKDWWLEEDYGWSCLSPLSNPPEDHESDNGQSKTTNDVACNADDEAEHDTDPVSL